jgi:hypothetical protein
LKQRHIPGLIDIFEVNDPNEIKALANHPAIDRYFETPTCPVNWFLLKRSLSVLSYEGHRFPTMNPRHYGSRQRDQDELWRRLDDHAEEIKAGPDSLTPLAEWVKGAGSSAEVGILAQGLLGRLFCADFNATQETWSAALILVAAPRSANLPKILWCFATGKIRRAKAILGELMGGDLSAVNAIGIAVHNLVKGLHHMRLLYSDMEVRRTLSPAEAAAQCLHAPVSVYRQSTRRGMLFGRPFRKRSLFVLNIGTASRCQDGQSLVFMEDSWSRCPASTWVPAMLEGVWRQASSKETNPAAETVNP